MKISWVKVYSTTKVKDRWAMGKQITDWINRMPPGAEVVRTEVRQSSDREFHCLSIVFFGWSPTGIVPR